MHTGDALVDVTRLASGTGTGVGGTWYLSLDGEASERIAADARAEDVLIAVNNLTSAGNVTVTDGVGGDGPNGERSWVIHFHDWNNPNRTATNPIVAVGDEGLTGTAALATVDGGAFEVSEFCHKAVVQVSSSLTAGEIDDCVFTADWQGGASYTVPLFAFDANSSMVEEALASIDSEVLGVVWVSRDDDSTGAAEGVWNITFVENAEGRTPDLGCGSDAAVLQLVNATCEAIGGNFSVGFGGNLTRDISYSATDSEVREKVDG